jgi:hypothetical protein
MYKNEENEAPALTTISNVVHMDNFSMVSVKVNIVEEFDQVTKLDRNKNNLQMK